MYIYNALVTDVYDGDSITCDVDVGFGVWLKKQKFRLLYINTPEIRGEERPDGLISRDMLRDQILGKMVIIKTTKDSKGKYGRWLAEVFNEDMNINTWLLDEGYAKPYV
jgi:micrococcal nuclease